jgi:hypothetical protein
MGWFSVKVHTTICAAGLLVLTSIYGLGQSISDPNGTTDQMMTPPPVAGQAYPTAPMSQERSNYLRGGLAFTSAYIDNALGSVRGTPTSDVSYSIAPSIDVDETTARAHAVLRYSPGFTFYQRFSGLNEADQNASIEFSYRLSPHVTFSAKDTFQKSSSVFDQPDFGSVGSVSGNPEQVNFSVIAPIAERLSNNGTTGITYQFALNEMVGASGTFSNLHFPDQTQVPGLYDSSSQAGLAFYALRLPHKQYFGVTYQFQRLASYPSVGLDETQTHAALIFYSIYPAKGMSLSFFGGPQHSDTMQPISTGPALRQWLPMGGTSVGWQGHLTSVALSYVHTVASGGGLIGAVHIDSGNASFRQQIRRSLSGSLSGGYAQNDLVGGFLLGASNGHSISGTASIQQQVGGHIVAQLGYTRLRQDYSSVAILASTPNTNREFISISYQFSRPLGR